MSAIPSSLDKYLSCQICFEDFKEDGDLVPRILPCFHTLCEKCIKGMIKEGTLTCPECREEHEAKKEEKSFQQNKYILVQISKGKTDTKHDGTKMDICPEHRKEIILFCEEEGCKNYICRTCLTKEHKQHDFIEIEEKNKAAYLNKIEKVKQDLLKKMATLTKAKEDVLEKTKAAVENMKKAREEMKTKFNTMIAKAEDKAKVANSRTDTELQLIKTNVDTIDQMKLNAEREMILTNDNGTLEGIRNRINNDVCGIKRFEYHTFEASLHFGTFEKRAVTIILPERRDESVENITTPSKMLPVVLNISELKWRVTDTAISGLSSISNNCFAALTDGTVVICGKDGVNVKLKRFNISDKTENFCETLQHEPSGLAELNLAGRPALAISYSSQFKIEFRSLTDLSQIIHSYSTGSLKPAALCVASPSTLLFAHGSNPCDIYYLDFSGAEPKITGKKISTQLHFVRDICYVADKAKPLLIVIAGLSSLSAYNALSNELEWKTNVGGSNITTDGHNYIAICTIFGNGIKILSLSDGKDLGCLVKEGDHGLGKPYRVEWNKTTSSLFLANVVNQKIEISTIQLD